MRKSVRRYPCYVSDEIEQAGHEDGSSDNEDDDLKRPQERAPRVCRLEQLVQKGASHFHLQFTEGHREYTRAESSESQARRLQVSRSVNLLRPSGMSASHAVVELAHGPGWIDRLVLAPCPPGNIREDNRHEADRNNCDHGALLDTWGTVSIHRQSQASAWPWPSCSCWARPPKRSARRELGAFSSISSPSGLGTLSRRMPSIRAAHHRERRAQFPPCLAPAR